MEDIAAPTGMEGLTENEHLYRLFFESSGDAFYVISVSPDGEAESFTDVNQRACDMLGYTREQLLALSPLSIDDESSEKAWRAAHRRLRRRGRDRYSRMHIASDGRRIPVEISARVFHRRESTYVLAVARDITERHEAEVRLKHRQQDLQGLVDASLEFSALVEPDTTILRINEVGARRWRSTPEALKGQRITDLSPSDIAPQRLQVAREVVEQRKAIRFCDFRDGFWLENSVSPVIDDHGDVSRFAIFSRDVTVPHLSRELDSLFNDIDRNVLSGTPVRVLVTAVNACLIDVFRSPLVWFEEHLGGAADSMWVCQGSWSSAGRSCPKLNPDIADAESKETESCLRIVKKTDSTRQILEGMSYQQPESLALLCIKLPEGRSGTLAIASVFAESFDPGPIRELLIHAAGRLQLAFELASDHRQLGLVRQALKTAHSAVLIADSDGCIVWTNQAFTKSTGYGRGDIRSVDALALTPLQTSDLAQRDAPVELEDTSLFKHVVQSGEVWSGEAVLKRRDGSSLTVLQTVTPVFSAQGEVTHLVAIQDDITERKLDEQQILYLAEHDPLTGLHNRAYLLEHLHHLLVESRRGQHHNMAFFYLDIDHFKEINDHYGHAAGDELLISFSQCLRDVVRQGDLVCRIGGDEFVLVLMDIRSPMEAQGIACKLLENLAQPIDFKGRALTVTSSIGISIAPRDGGTPEILLQRADAAMYEAKRLGRGRASFYSSVADV